MTHASHASTWGSTRTFWKAQDPCHRQDALEAVETVEDIEIDVLSDNES